MVGKRKASEEEKKDEDSEDSEELFVGKKKRLQKGKSKEEEKSAKTSDASLNGATRRSNRNAGKPEKSYDIDKILDAAYAQD